MAGANGLAGRVAALEAIRGPCGACRERRRHIFMPGEPVPERCAGCARPIEPLTFTIAIDRAGGPEGDAA